MIRGEWGGGGEIFSTLCYKQQPGENYTFFFVLNRLCILHYILGSSSHEVCIIKEISCEFFFEMFFFLHFIKGKYIDIKFKLVTIKYCEPVGLIMFTEKHIQC
jgi:hypothetical protein